MRYWRLPYLNGIYQSFTCNKRRWTIIFGECILQKKTTTSDKQDLRRPVFPRRFPKLIYDSDFNISIKPPQSVLLQLHQLVLTSLIIIIINLSLGLAPKQTSSVFVQITLQSSQARKLFCFVCDNFPPVPVRFQPASHHRELCGKLLPLKWPHTTRQLVFLFATQSGFTAFAATAESSKVRS